jgi:hypothetical protein
METNIVATRYGPFSQTTPTTRERLLAMAAVIGAYAALLGLLSLVNRLAGA